MRKADGDSSEGTVRQLGVQRVVEAIGVLAAAYLELIVDAGAFGRFEHDVPQRGRGYLPHGHPIGQPENPLRKMHLVGLTSKRKVQWRPSTMGTS